MSKDFVSVISALSMSNGRKKIKSKVVLLYWWATQKRKRKPYQDEHPESGETHLHLDCGLRLWTPEIGQTEVHKHNPRPTPQGSEPDGRWPAPRPWAVRVVISVLTQLGCFFALAGARAAILPTGPRVLGRAEMANKHSLRLTKRGSRPQKAQD